MDIKRIDKNRLNEKFEITVTNYLSVHIYTGSVIATHWQRIEHRVATTPFLQS